NALTRGQPGFFEPRFPPPYLVQGGGAAATSFYDTTPLLQTLRDYVDFDLLNRGDVRVSLGAVNVRTGNFADVGEVGEETGQAMRRQHAGDAAHAAAQFGQTVHDDQNAQRKAKNQLAGVVRFNHGDLYVPEVDRRTGA
ncbi:hypothetical protein AZ18_3027, partial [Bordetella bronchiseptica D993]